MATMITRLAEEVLAMILAPSLTVPYSQLTSRYPRTFGGNDLIPSSSVLLVCKRWLRVATPLLYETVVIRSTGQSYALVEALQLNPSFARYIKNVRLEGAYGGVYDILKYCRKLSTLILFLNIYSESRITCLSRALPAIDPKHVFLFDGGAIDNVKFRKLLRTICDSIPTWKNLVTFGYPYATMAGTVRLKPDNRTRRSLLSDALIQCKSLRLIYCDESEDQIDVHSLQSLAQIPSIIIRIVCDPPDQERFYRNFKANMVKEISKNTLLSLSSFEFVNRSEQFTPLRFVKKPQKFAAVDSISFNNDSVMRVSDIVWADIFLLATMPSNEFSVRDCEVLRGNVKLVCQRFSRVVSYISCTHPLLRNSMKLRQFTNEVRRAPYLGNLVVELELFDTSEGRACMVADLCNLFPHLTSLRYLHISRTSLNGTLLMPPHALALLAASAGGSLRSIRLDFRGDLPLSPHVLNSFKNLVNVDMTHACPLSTDTTGLGLDTLVSLQELHLSGGSSFLNTLTVLGLPQLRVVVFSGSNPPIDAFMEACGTHVEELHFTGGANFILLFRHAPKLRNLRWGPSIRKQRQYQDIIASSFENFGSHSSLQTLRLVDLPGYRCDTEKSKVLRLIFERLRLANFPGLKELQFEHYRWPDDERSIQRDVLPGIAVSIKKEFAIEITDLTGKPWRPRVQKDRHPGLHVVGPSVGLPSNQI